MRGTIAIALLLLMAAVGCQQEQTGGPTSSDYEAARRKALAQSKGDRKAPEAPQAAQAPATTGQGAGPAPEADPSEPSGVRVARYHYDPTGKRDPFRSFVLENAKEEAEKEAGPLEQFDVSQLTVVAVVWDTDRPKALVADPSGRPYIIGEGARVGKNDGRVTQIADGGIVVKETYVDWLGEQTTKDIEMRLHREGKGGDLR